MTPQTPDEMWLNVLTALESLGSTMGDIAKATNDQRVSIEHVRARAKRSQVVVLLLVVVLQFVTIAVLRAGQRQLGDCIDPTGKCAQRAAAKTGEAVRALQCVDILLDGQRPAACETERERLEAAGIVLP